MRKNLLFNRNYVLPVLVSLVCGSATAQKSARATAEEMFAKGEYYTAAKLYEQILAGKMKGQKKDEFKPYFTQLTSQRKYQTKTISTGKEHMIWNTAECYRMIHDFENALLWYKKIIDARSTSSFPLTQYWYGVSLRAFEQYDDAELALQQFIKSYPANDAYKIAAEQELKNIAFIRSQLSKGPVYYARRFDHAAPGNFSAALVKPGVIAFTAVHTDSAAFKKNENPYKDRLFTGNIADSGVANFQLMNIENVDQSKQQGTPAFFANGTKMYFTQWEKQNDKKIAKIYFSAAQNDKWSKPVEVSSINATGSNSMQPFVTADGKYVFFSSDRAGGFGKYDIWYATISNNEITSAPVNAGSIINTAENEQSPFYAVKQQELVFATDGRTGFGGLDLFRAHGVINAWSTPENMGPGINSSRDDVYFFTSDEIKNNTDAFISSDRSSNCCLDLFRVTAPQNGVVINFTDCKTGEKITNGTIAGYNNAGILSSETAPVQPSGKIGMILPDGTMRSSVSSPGYISKDFSISLEPADFFRHTDTTINICLDKVAATPPAQTTTTNESNPDLHVYFDFDRSNLDAESKATLNELSTLLKENKTWTIEIGGYTDENGSDQYNLALGLRRAKAAAQYLQRSGVSVARIKVKSYGKCCPLEDVPNDPQHKTDRANRRIQFIFFK